MNTKQIVRCLIFWELLWQYLKNKKIYCLIKQKTKDISLVILQYRVLQKSWYLGGPVLLLNAKYEALMKENWIAILFIYLKAKWILCIIISEYIPANFRKKNDVLFNWWFGGVFPPLAFRALFFLKHWLFIWQFDTLSISASGCQVVVWQLIYFFFG